MTLAATPEARLEALGLRLPVLSPVRGSYVRARRYEGLLYLAGHGPPPDEHGVRPTGRVGAEVSADEAYELARRTGLALVSTLATELGRLSRVELFVSVFGMVAVAPGFDATPAVVDGCSDLLIEVFGPEIGAHARSAIGVAALPYGLPVEIEAVVAIQRDGVA